jgi:hypothetical protein
MRSLRVLLQHGDGAHQLVAGEEGQTGQTTFKPTTTPASAVPHPDPVAQIPDRSFPDPLRSAESCSPSVPMITAGRRFDAVCAACLALINCQRVSEG